MSQLSQKLTPDAVFYLLSQRLLETKGNNAGYCLLYETPAAIIRAIDGNSQPEDFLGTALLTLTQFKKLCPTSQAVVEFGDRPEYFFVAVASVSPTSQDDIIPHTVMTIKEQFASEKLNLTGIK